MLKVAIIGLGGIGKMAINTLLKTEHEGRPYEIVGALVRDSGSDGCNDASLSIPLFDDITSLLATKPDVVAECASHSAVVKYGEEILRSGAKLILVSVGALADDGLYNRLIAAANEGNTSLLIAAGAIGGLDALSAAKFSGLEKVTYRARKPAMAWSGTPAEKILKLDSLSKAETFFVGSARDAALQFPKNSNVAATVALAGLGMDLTEVVLIADPNISDNFHEIEVTAKSGVFTISLAGKTLPDSTKTSALAAYSVAKCLSDLNSAIVV
jgi:aspartate dehydrogenase